MVSTVPWRRSQASNTGEGEGEDSLDEEERERQSDGQESNYNAQSIISETNISAVEQEEQRLHEAVEKARLDKLLGNDLRRNRKEDVNFLPSSASQAGKSLIHERQ